ERRVPGGRVYAALQVVDFFQLRHLGADQTQDHDFTFWQKSQRLEPTAPRRVVLEQETVMIELVGPPFRNIVVRSFPVPPAALVATAEMDTESHVVKPIENSVVCPEGAAEVLFGILVPISHRLQRCGVDVSRIARRIDLNVTTSRLDQSTNHFSLHSD